jgi:hypothetical protein
LSRVTAVALCALACVSMIVGRVVWSSRAELQHARTFGPSDLEQRIFYLGVAARLYVPGNPYSRAALDELAAIGATSGTNALAANRAARSAIYATRSFYTREPQLLATVNQRIAAAMAELEVSADAHTDRAKSVAWHLDKLNADDAPSTAWSLVAIFGCALWIGAAFVFTRRGFSRSGANDDETLHVPYALASASGVVVGMALFWLGLHLA